jgi:RsiW-degrading membrane proteinase PrsW (M82 family)
VQAEHLLASIIFAAAAGAWFTYFRLKASPAKPFLWMLVAILGGHLSALVSLLAYDALEALGYSTQWSLLQEGWGLGLRTSLCIGFVEEGSKLLPVLVLILVSKRVTRSHDGLFLAACAGLGFAVAENVVFLSQGITLVESAARAVVTPVTHALFAAPWGLGLAHFILRRRASLLIGAFATSVSAHGAYDLFLAHPGVPVVTSALVVLGLWAWFITHASPPTGRRTPALAIAHTGSHSLVS